MRNQKHHHLRSYGEAAEQTDGRPVRSLSLTIHPAPARAKRERKLLHAVVTTVQPAQCYDEGNLRGSAAQEEEEEDCAEGSSALKLHHIFGDENGEIHPSTHSHSVFPRPDSRNASPSLAVVNPLERDHVSVQEQQQHQSQRWRRR